MTNYKKRKRRKGGIKGCGLCKPHKTQGCRNVESNKPLAVQRANISKKEQLSPEEEWTKYDQWAATEEVIS